MRSGTANHFTLLNRRNALFAGSDEGGDNWAVIAALSQCCTLNAIIPHGWPTDTLASLVCGHLANRAGELIPWAAVA
ncbi:hypothetical protein NEE01_03100 [Sphingomonas sp. MMSM24]|uniref:Transposase domain-containing protein n=1 Tax=Sphingomonas lycopersici TaxID=2951807 RepID=A0AA41Z494_9SPHN|nr:hypothetical protein [Sphingomonas lycopersici]